MTPREGLAPPPGLTPGRGWAGGPIREHRAFVTLQATRTGALAGIGVIAVFLLLWLASLAPLGEAYIGVYRWSLARLDPTAVVVPVTIRVAGPLEFRLPWVDAPAAPTSDAQSLTLVAACLVALLVSFLLPTRFIPIAYGLRIATALQAGTLAWIEARGAPLPYSVPGYVLDQSLAGLALLGVVPLVLGLTYYVFPFSWGRKCGLTAALMGHMAVLIGLQGLVVVSLLRAGSLAVLPVLFVFLGLLPEVMVFVAFYGWGMSWPWKEERA